MPQSPNHPPFRHALPRRHGDMVRADGGSAANDIIVMGTHVGTHIDALAHVSQDGSCTAASTRPRPARRRLRRARRRHDRADGAAAACCSTSPPPSGVDELRGRLRDHPRRPRGRRATRQGTEIRAGDVVLIRTGWGRRFADGTACATSGTTTGVPGVGEAGARWLADKRRPRRRRRHHRVRAAAGRRRARVCPRTGCCSSRHGIYIIEALDLDELAAAGVARVHLRARPAAPRRRHRLPGAPARGGRPVTEQTLAQRLAALRRRGARDDGVPARRSSPACAQRVLDILGICVAAHRAGDQPRRDRPASPTRAARPGRTSSACRERSPPRRPPSSTASSRTRSTTTTRTCRRCCTPAPAVVPAALAAAEAARCRRARHDRAPSPSASRSCVRLGMAGYDRELGQLDLLRARPARHLHLRRDRRRGRGRHAARPRRGRADRTSSGVAASMASGIIEAQPHRRHRQADALRLGRPRRRLRRRAGRARASPARRPCSRAGSASSRRSCTASSTADEITDGLGEQLGGARTSSSSPTRPTTSPTPPSTPALALRARGVRPERRSTSIDRRRRRPAVSAPSASRSRSSAPRTPATMAQFSGPYAVAAGAARRRRARARARRLHRRAGPGPAAPRADGARSTSSPTRACDAIFPHQFPAVLRGAHRPTAASSSRRSWPTAAARSVRCPTRSSAMKFARQRRPGPRRRRASPSIQDDLSLGMERARRRRRPARRRPARHRSGPLTHTDSSTTHRRRTLDV